MKKSRKICETKRGYNKTSWRKITSPAGMKLLIKLVLRDSLPRIESLKAFFHAGVVDAQKLVL